MGHNARQNGQNGGQTAHNVGLLPPDEYDRESYHRLLMAACLKWMRIVSALDDPGNMRQKLIRQLEMATEQPDD